MEFEEIWSRIIKHQNEIFHTKSGLELKYEVKGDKLYHNRTEPEISKSDFIRVHKKYPFSGLSEIRGLVRGPT
jgi:hypothetical protein